MRNIVFTFLFSLITTGLLSQNENFHSFTVKDISGNDFHLSALKGKKVLVVNTASKCGFTPQYAELQKLYETHGNEQFEIVAFPANDFLNQEPGSNAEILDFCTETYAVTFPVMSKISVKGKNIHPLYQWLTDKKQNGVADSKVSWNFQKYIIDENGNLLKSFSPKTSPLDQAIVDILIQ